MDLAFPPAPLRPSHRAALGLVLLLAGAVVPAGAETPLTDLPPMSAAPEVLLAAAAEREPAEDDSVDVLLDSTRIVFDGDGTSTLRKHQIYRVIDSDGVELHDEVSTVYAPWHQETPSVRARVILPSGAVHELDPSTLSEGAIESDLPNTYQDLRRLVAPLPAVAPGTVVETVIETVDRAPFFEAGTLHRVPILSFGGPIRHARVVIDAPEGMELAIEARPEALAEPRVETSNGRVRRTFDMRDLPRPELWLPGQPPEEVLYPFVAVSTARDWSGLATYYSRVVDRQIAALGAPDGGSLLGADTPDAGAESQWEQIAARVAWVHERVRYTGVQLGEAAIVPRPPGETLARRYGDCKDKATLVVALLREIGVPAYVALLRAGAPDDVLTELPGIGAGGFDHAIVYVPGSPALWIDATDPTAALGELPTMSQGRLALVASPGTRELIRTPVASADDNRTAETREIFLPQFGEGRAVVRTVYRGGHARDARGLWEGSTPEEIAEDLGTMASGMLGSSEIEGFEISPLATPGPLEFSYRVEDATWAVTDMTEGVVGISEGVLLADLPFLGFDVDDEEEEDDPRTLDFYLPAPYETEVLYRIHVPEGFSVRRLPESGTRTFGPATLTSEYEETDGEVRARLTFRIAERRLSPDQLRALRDEIDAFQKEEVPRVWLDNVGWKHLTAGRIDEAIAENQRMVSAHPDEAVHLLRLGQALLEVGLIEEAERLTRRATELEPENDLPYAILGEILMRDRVGRELTHGFDREGAIAALRRAHELEPDNLVVLFNLAVALEHDAEGRRYRDPEGLAEAIELYRSIEEETLEASGYRNNLAIALFRAGRHEEVVEMLADETADRVRFALLIAAEAMLNGPEAAIARAERRVGGGRSERATVLAMASQNLLLERRYAEAGALLRTAARSAPSSQADPGMLEMFGHLRRHEEVENDLDGPVAVIHRLIAAMLREDLDTTTLREIMALDWFRTADEEVLERELRDLTGEVAVPRMPELGLDDDFFLDVLTSGIAWTVEERPPLGIWVEMKPKVDGLDSFAQADGAFVLEAGDTPRLITTEDSPAGYGRYAFELARDGEVERAAAFLDHALESAEAPEEDSTLWSASEMLHSFWPPEDRGDAGAVILAGAVLACEDLADEELLGVLRTARVTDEQKPVLDQAVASALLALERWDEAVELGRAIDEETGESFYLRNALLRSHRLAEVADIIEAELEDEDGPRARQPEAMRAESLSQAGRYEEALAAWTALLEKPDNTGFSYNQAAWLATAIGKTDETTIEWGRRAVASSDPPEQAHLHTLATVFAAEGRTLEAYDTLLRAIDADPRAEIREYDWYTLGRIAEHHGLLAAARDYYRRIEPPEEDADRTSTRVMAKERLRALDGGGGL